jgi:hypothetical protein
MTDAELSDICGKLAEGRSLRSICRELGKGESAVRMWFVRHPERMENIITARELGCDALADECLDIADGNDKSDDKRIRIDTRIRLIGKWSQRYSDKQQIEHKHDLSDEAKAWLGLTS